MSELTSYMITDRMAHERAVRRICAINDLTPKQFDIMAIAVHMVDKRSAYVTTDDIKASLPCSPVTLSKAINKLIAQGELKEFRRRKLNNNYYLAPTDSGRSLVAKYLYFFRMEKDQHIQRLIKRREKRVI